jgi:hypothetical protein
MLNLDESKLEMHLMESGDRVGVELSFGFNSTKDLHVNFDSVLRTPEQVAAFFEKTFKPLINDK